MGYWVQALKDDPREIYRASQDAQVMSDYLLDRTREKGPQRKADPAVERSQEAAREQPPLVRPLPEQPGFRRHFPRGGGGTEPLARPGAWRIRRSRIDSETWHS